MRQKRKSFNLYRKSSGIYYCRIRDENTRSHTPARIHRFIDYLKAEGVTVRPVNRIVQFIKTYLSWAYKRDYILSDILSRIIKEKEPKSKRGFLIPDEIIIPAGFKSEASCRPGTFCRPSSG